MIAAAEPGVVSATSPLTVKLDTAPDTDMPAGRLVSYTPAVGDKVAIVKLPGRRLLVLDRIVT